MSTRGALLLTYFVLLFSGHCLIATKTENANQNESREGSILRRYFNTLGLAVDENDEVFIKRYSSSVIDKMQAMLKSNDVERLPGLIREINKAIYKQERDKLSVRGDSKLSLNEQALLNSLDLMLPGDEQINASTKDLKKFSAEQPELAHDLLDRLLYLVDNEALDTYKAAHLLSGFYLRWIPLGRLGKFIDSNVES